MKFKRLYNSFRDAIRGAVFVFREEQNFRLQIYVTIFVFIMVWFFGLRKHEIIVIALLILLVLTLELLNSALEKFADVVKPRLSYQVQVIKDIMSAMVLLASLGAVVIGVIVFFPYIIELIFK